jgi:hypothetical protein
VGRCPLFVKDVLSMRWLLRLNVMIWNGSGSNLGS